MKFKKSVGIILIAVGAYVIIESDQYSYLFGDDDTLTTVSGIIIGTGGFIFLVGFCACCGAIKEVVCLLQVYFVLIVLVILLEVVAAILAFVFQDDLTKIVKENMDIAISTDYGNLDVATTTIATVQRQFDCCGSSGIDDWLTSDWGLKNLLYSAPTSCCKDPQENCNLRTNIPSQMNEEGCVDTFTTWIEGNYLIVGGVCLGLLVFEILALLFTCCLIRGIKSGGD